MNTLRYCFKYPQNKLLLVVNIIVLFFFIYTFSGWFIVGEENNKLRMQIDDITQNVSNKLQLSNISEAYLTAAEELKEFEEVSSQQIHQSSLILTLDELAKHNNINIISQNFERYQDNNNITGLLLYLNIESKFISIYKFLEQLHSSSILFSVDEASFTRSRSSTNQVQATLRITLYNTEISEKDEFNE